MTHIIIFIYISLINHSVSMELRKRNCSRDNILGKNLFINQVNNLLKNIKIVEYSLSDIPLVIIKYFSEKNFRSLSPNEIIKYITNFILFPSLAKITNIKDEIISALRNNCIFEQSKKKAKYDLNLEKCANYLSTYQSSNNKYTNSDSKIISQPPIMTFPENENNIVYFASDNNQLNMSFILDEEKIDNSFTFGEQTIIKSSNKDNQKMINMKLDNNEPKENINNLNTDELENKAQEKYIPKFEFVFDEKKNFASLLKVANEFFNIYKRINLNEININKLNESIKKVNLVMNELNVNKEPFNKLSSLFNEEKNELFNANSVIKQQLELLRILVENNFFSKEFYDNEKEILISFQDKFKRLLNKLQEDFDEIKKMEDKINDIIFNLKNLLNGISDEFVLKSNDNYSKFYNLIKSISKNKNVSINVNMDETVKLFYSYIAEFEKAFDKIEEKQKESNLKK